MAENWVTISTWATNLPGCWENLLEFPDFVIGWLHFFMIYFHYMKNGPATMYAQESI